MDQVSFENVESTTKGSKGANKKRKWREIEAIKDRIRLEEELQSIDFNYSLSEEFEY
ncbi:DUF3545 family protein [Alginatibacterium sediminis]|uniref:DUF3545 family protein n=1 Tax=Alginatibacterium sediminis TaxID=2164068 RepID=A0A420EDV9_9ALTE|nr:DUF3545 family protein [Alginatibacterium sediminis]RKF18861.1 DUF3545 family protein [Alginatibacterium sediminis]